MQKIKIYRSSILDATFTYKKEVVEFKWAHFGLQYVPHTEPTDRFLYFNVVDKQKLTWAMLKYGFLVYDIDSCY